MNIALVYSHVKSSWVSCQTITPNLISAYESLTIVQEFKHFDYNGNLSDFGTLKIAREIFEFCPDKIIIADHTPHPYLLIRFLSSIYEENKTQKFPELIIHIYGDFTLYPKEWLRTEVFLKNYLVKLVCASDRQANLIEKFVPSNSKNILKCSFPVDISKYYFDYESRDSLRELNQISEDDIIFLYTGRLSFQKNILELISYFSTLFPLITQRVKLYIAGPFDEVGAPFIGYTGNGKELYEMACMKAIERVNIELGRNDAISYLGNLEQEDLQKIYNASDIYISLSGHNDEDYGMSPAEALCTGLPAVLSNWGGYASFKHPFENNECHLVATKIGDGKIEINRADLLNTLMCTIDRVVELRKKRAELEKINRSFLSIQSSKEIIEQILLIPGNQFEGFSDLFVEFENALLAPVSPLGTIQFFYSSLYKRIYNSYVP